MHLIEVLERRRQLAYYAGSIAQIHAAEVIAAKRIDEAFGHAVALRAAHRYRVGLESQLAGHLARLSGNVSTTVITQELQCVTARH